MFHKRRQPLKLAIVHTNFQTGIDAALWFRRLAQAAAAMLGLIVGMLALDDRTLAGEPVWLKPSKFAASFLIFFATLAMVAERLSPNWRRSWLVLAGAGASAAAFFFEMAYIGAQSARQEPSHFNESTPFHEMMYGLMGTGATALLLTVAVLAIAVWSDGGARVGVRLRLSIVLGFVLTVVLTFWVAGELAGHGGRYIGMPSDGAAKLPVLGWSMEVGDLRPAHFFALHAMQALPLVGYLADRYQLSSRVVWIAAALYATFTIMIFLKALQGIPLISA